MIVTVILAPTTSPTRATGPPRERAGPLRGCVLSCRSATCERAHERRGVAGVPRPVTASQPVPAGKPGTPEPAWVLSPFVTSKKSAWYVAGLLANE